MRDENFIYKKLKDDLLTEEIDEEKKYKSEKDFMFDLLKINIENHNEIEIRKFLKKYEKLDKKEKIIICLILMNYKNNDIASILNLKINTIYCYKNRILKKIK